MKNRLCAFLLSVFISGLALGLTFSPSAQAEYADIILNKWASESGMRPVIFSHWFHRLRFRCKVCHADLGFEMRAGANDMTMKSIEEGKFCGECHNGEIAWGVENCDMCHSGKPGLKTRVVGGHQTLGPGKF